MFSKCCRVYILKILCRWRKQFSVWSWMLLMKYYSLVVILVHMWRKYTSILLQHLYKATIKNVLIVIYTVHYINGIFETILKYCLHLMFTVSVSTIYNIRCCVVWIRYKLEWKANIGSENHIYQLFLVIPHLFNL